MILIRLAATLLVGAFSLTSCESGTPKPEVVQSTTPKRDTARQEQPAPPPPPVITYHVLTKKDSVRKNINKIYSEEERYLIYALNRLDAANARRPDTLIVPDTFIQDRLAYSPFPQQLPFLNEVRKIVYFSYAIQAFAAYEQGNLVYWGPSSMGKKATPTPTGLFFTNWKAKEAISTVDDEWKLRWNFNISNRGGVGWHQYAMPGYPASHSCLRMLEEDALHMYTWADQWILKNSETMLASGTPTIVYGEYPWGQPRPWFALLGDPKANDISVEALQQETAEYLPKILAEQQRRDSVVAQRQAATPPAAPDSAAAQ